MNDKTLVSPLFNALPSDKSPKTFSIAGQYSLLVPKGTTSITFKVWGAGGDGQGENNASCSPVNRSGGGGGYAQGTLSVAEGKEIFILVGDSTSGSPVGLSEFGAGPAGQSSSVYYENEIIAMAGGGGGGAGFYGGLGGSGNSDLGNCTGSGGGGGSGYLHPNTTSRISLNGSSGSPTGALAVNRSDPHYSAGTGGSGQPGSVTIIFN